MTVGLYHLLRRLWVLTVFLSLLLIYFTAVYGSIRVACQDPILPFESESVSHSVMSDSLQPHGLSPQGSSVHGVPQARLLEWIAIPFLIQGLNPGLPPCRQILYHLSHQGSLEVKNKGFGIWVQTLAWLLRALRKLLNFWAPVSLPIKWG